MKININNKEIEIINGETVLDTANRMGCEIPTLCYAKGKKHRSSCMVCVVKNRTNGQIIPSCTTYPTADMDIETDSDEVRQIRALSLELLLSDHRADCEAPCSMVCPKGLDVELLLHYYDVNQHEKAYLLIAETFDLSKIACDTCKASCEKACRRGTVDQAVSIREIIKQIVQMPDLSTSKTGKKDHLSESTSMNGSLYLKKISNKTNSFQSRPGRFSSCEKERLKTTVTTPSRCLHCACAGRTNCKLRLYATAAGIKRPRYEVTSALPVLHKQQINDRLWFEQAKCIRCGLCVYNSDNGFTFKDRGFGMSVILPDENRDHICDDLAVLCPTGAIYECTIKYEVNLSGF